MNLSKGDVLVVLLDFVSIKFSLERSLDLKVFSESEQIASLKRVGQTLNPHTETWATIQTFPGTRLYRGKTRDEVEDSVRRWGKLFKIGDLVMSWGSQEGHDILLALYSDKRL